MEPSIAFVAVCCSRSGRREVGRGRWGAVCVDSLEKLNCMR